MRCCWFASVFPKLFNELHHGCELWELNSSWLPGRRGLLRAQEPHLWQLRQRGLPAHRCLGRDLGLMPAQMITVVGPGLELHFCDGATTVSHDLANFLKYCLQLPLWNSKVTPSQRSDTSGYLKYLEVLLNNYTEIKISFPKRKNRKLGLSPLEYF